MTQTEHGSAVASQLSGRERASGLLCPACRGGRTGERSLIAWRDGLLLKAKCKRAKCGWWGCWDGVDAGLVPTSAAPVHARRYHVETLPLSDATVAALEARYRVAPATLHRFGLRQMPGARGVYCPVLSPMNRSRGLVRRWLDGTLPKVKGFPGHDHPAGAAWQAWFHADSGCRLLVCVEDVFSAMRLWQEGVTAVALLGVSLTPLKLAELRRHADTIVVALDADAFTLAIAAALRYHVEVRRVEPDIKDMTEEQLLTWINALFSSLPASSHGRRTAP